jgi:hypothetical protein
LTRAQLALLATLAWTRRPGVAELAEDLAQPVVDRLENRRVLVQGSLAQPGEPGDGVVDSRVTC